MHLLNSGDGNDGAHLRLLYGNLLQTLELIQCVDLALDALVFIVVVDENNILSDADGAVGNLADTDAADIVIIVNGRDQNLRGSLRISGRSRDVLDDGFEQRLHGNSGASKIKRCNSGLCGSKNKRAVELLIVCAKVHEKLQNLIDDLSRTSSGTVDLVDADDDGKAKSHCLGQNKTGLRHRAFKCIHYKDDAVHHLQNTLYLTAEIGVAGSVKDVDFDAVVVDSGILTGNGNASLTFDGAGVHDSVGNRLVLAEHAALTKQAVNQSCFAVVNVSNDGNVSNVFSFLDHKNLYLIYMQKQFCFKPHDYSIGKANMQHGLHGNDMVE